jgi:hypothetical protein
MLIFKGTISGVTPINTTAGVFRHQFDFAGTTGTVAIALEAGTGPRLIETVDLSNVSRVPFVIEGEDLSFVLTPSTATLTAYNREAK